MSWDDIAESWWMWADQSIMQLTSTNPLRHTRHRLRPAFSEVAEQHESIRPGVKFYGAKVMFRLAADHPLRRKNKFVGLNGNIVGKLSGIVRRTTAGCRVKFDLYTESGDFVERNTIVPYDCLEFTGTQYSPPSDDIMECPVDAEDAEVSLLYEDSEWLYNVECRLCEKWRCTTQEHSAKVTAAIDSNAHLAQNDPERQDEFDTCPQIPMPALGMTIYYSCLYPEEKFLTTEEEEDARSGQRAGSLKRVSHELYRDEVCGDGEDIAIRGLRPEGGDGDDDDGPPDDPPPPDHDVRDHDLEAAIAESIADAPSAGPAAPAAPAAPAGPAAPSAPAGAWHRGVNDRDGMGHGVVTRSRTRDNQQSARLHHAHMQSLANAQVAPRAARPRRPAAPASGTVVLTPREGVPEEAPAGEGINRPPAEVFDPLFPEPDEAPASDNDHGGLSDLFGDGESEGPDGGAEPGRVAFSEEDGVPYLDDLFCDPLEGDSDVDHDNCPYDYSNAFDDDELIDSVEIDSVEGHPFNPANMMREFMCCARGAIMTQILVAKAAASRSYARYKGAQRRKRRTEAKNLEAQGKTDELIGHMDHDRVPADAKIHARIKFKPGKQKQAIQELIKFQQTVGAPSTSEGFSDHDDPLTKWAARVTKTLTRTEALKDVKYNHLDWDKAIQKECKTMRTFGVMGKVYAEEEVINRRFYNVARLLGAWAIKNFELLLSMWDPRYRCVYGGNDPRRADGSTALYATSASLPASLRDFRIFAVIASLHSWSLWLGDVTGAYLNAAAPPDTFVVLSEEMIDHLLDPDEAEKYRQLQKAGKKPVVELLKALYGHTQAGFLWEAEARKQLLKMGFVNFSDVSSAWYLHYTGEGNLDGMLLLYVDDFMLAGTDHFRNSIVSKMKEIWELKNGDIHPVGQGPIVGMRYDQHEIEHGPNPITNVIVDQRAYSSMVVDSFIAETGCPESELKRTDVPAHPGDQVAVFAADSPEGAAHINGQYAEHAAAIIGKLMWLCRTGLFMITIAVHNLSRHVLQWGEPIDKQCRRLMAWIRDHKEGILLLRTAPQDLKQKKLKLLVFSDADHAGDKGTRKSVSGCGIVLSGPNGTWSLVEWISRAQRTISLSTGESELLAAQLSLREALIVLLLLEMLQVAVEVELLVDSATALSVLLTGLSSKMRYSAKSQGLATAWCAAMLRDFNIRARKVATDHNIADIFTKAVDSFTFGSLTRLCGWVHTDDAKKPRCTSFHQSPAHDEPTRCLNIVGKEGERCAACQTEIGCRCFNGASTWDIRANEFVDRIPIGSTVGIGTHASAKLRPDAEAEPSDVGVTRHQDKPGIAKKKGDKVSGAPAPSRRSYSRNIDDVIDSSLPSVYWATPVLDSWRSS